jgi:hypothetical protein
VFSCDKKMLLQSHLSAYKQLWLKKGTNRICNTFSHWYISFYSTLFYSENLKYIRWCWWIYQIKRKSAVRRISMNRCYGGDGVRGPT